MRKSQKMGIGDAVNNLAMFALPCLGYALLGSIKHTSFSVSVMPLLYLFLASFFFSYLGNKFSIISTRLSPNSGYSLIISKSYVIFTTIVSFFLYGSEISVKNAMAIICILIFSAFIVITKSSKKNVEPSHGLQWFYYALGAFFAWGFLALVSKYFILIGIPVFTRLFYISFFVSCFVVFEFVFSKKKLVFEHAQFPVIIGISLASMAFNYYLQDGYALAPNPGYVNAVNAASIAALTIFSSFIFHDELTIQKLIGVIGVTAGLVLLFV